MRIPIPIEHVNADGLKTPSYGLTNLTLRKSPNFNTDDYTLTSLTGNVYETTNSVTADGFYKLYKNGVEQKWYGGTDGRFIITENSSIDPNNFNVGETLIVQSISGQKQFVAQSLSASISSSLTGLIQSGTATNQFLVWNNTSKIWEYKNTTQVKSIIGVTTVRYYIVEVNSNIDGISPVNTIKDDFGGNVSLNGFGDGDPGHYILQSAGNTTSLTSNCYLTITNKKDTATNFYYKTDFNITNNQLDFYQYLNGSINSDDNNYYLKFESYS